MEEWFALVWQKNKLVTQEADLVYELKDLELIEQHDELEKDIRKRLAKDGEGGNEMIASFPGPQLFRLHVGKSRLSCFRTGAGLGTRPGMRCYVSVW